MSQTASDHAWDAGVTCLRREGHEIPLTSGAEAHERSHLEQVKLRLGRALASLEARVTRYADDSRDEKTYLWEQRADLDRAETLWVREAARRTVLTGEAVLAARKRVGRLLASPYFGRFDFLKDRAAEPLPVYLGIHSFSDEEGREPLVFDWRAPIASLFYDCELGRARYRSPYGPISGEVVLKRQYRIRGGQMEFMLESGLSILDDVLQKELSRTSDDRMKTIVATIQRDQNQIIRNEDAPVLVIQGVAGSGKTSIALHRIAFLLYRFHDRLTSKNILIVSPNKVFADFISNVLPELGEERIAEVDMDKLAHELLEHKYEFQTSLEQSVSLLDGTDADLRARVREKSSLGFLERLEAYAAHVERARFRPEEVRLGRFAVSASFVARAYGERPRLPMADRLRWVADSIERQLWVEHQQEITTKERTAIRMAVHKMYGGTALLALYKALFKWMGRPELFRPGSKATLEYADVFPMIYLKLRLEGAPGGYEEVRHLVVDEMQDYSPVQYAVMARLFPCDKTILGDVNQAVNPFNSSTAETIGSVLRDAECVKLCKSYRSSYEITRFAQSISPSADLVAIERHGDKPLIVACQTEAEELDHMVRAIRELPTRGYQTMAIVCKTPKQAEQLHRSFRERALAVPLLTVRSTAFVKGAMVCPVHLAKGLEFDWVLVPGVTEASYATEIDRNLLYIACTRAMHRLVLTHVGARTRFVVDASLFSRESPT